MRALPLTVVLLLIAAVALVAVGDVWAQAPVSPPAAAAPAASPAPAPKVDSGDTAFAATPAGTP